MYTYPTFTDVQWQAIVRAITAMDKAGYELSYWGNPDKGFTSGKYPSFKHKSGAPLNNMQLIWSHEDQNTVWLNHGYPDVYDKIRIELTNAGFYITLNKPNNKS